MMIMQRRTELLAKVAVQRQQASQIAMQLQFPLRVVDATLSVVRFLKSKPLLIVGLAAVLLARRRGIKGLLKGIWRVWTGYSSLQRIVATVLGRR
jgi:hypothetical protein